MKLRLKTVKNTPVAGRVPPSPSEPFNPTLKRRGKKKVFGSQAHSTRALISSSSQRKGFRRG